MFCLLSAEQSGTVCLRPRRRRDGGEVNAKRQTLNVQGSQLRNRDHGIKFRFP